MVQVKKLILLILTMTSLNENSSTYSIVSLTITKF